MYKFALFKFVFAIFAPVRLESLSEVPTRKAFVKLALVRSAPSIELPFRLACAKLALISFDLYK